MALTLDATADQPGATTGSPWLALWQLRHALAGVVLLLVAIFLGWYLSLVRVEDLGADNQLVKSGAYAQWQQGNVIVLIRHAERCDQSGGTCLGATDGITLAGTQAAQRVGSGLDKLGLNDALLLSSPLTRTRQTAAFAFGKEVPTAGWAGHCDADFVGNLMAHKTRHRNMVLVTHSGCIDHFLRKLHVQPGERDSDYAQAVLVSVNDQGKPRLLGALKAGQWQKLAVFQK